MSLPLNRSLYAIPLTAACVATSVAALIAVARVQMPLDTSSITQAAAGASPEPISGDHMFYDARLQQMVLVGVSKESPMELLWAWNGRQWQFIPNSGSGPTARDLANIAYDSRRHRLVLYGGAHRGERQDDTWEWDGRVWHKQNDVAPGRRDHHTMAFDAARGTTIMFSGSGTGSATATDTWEWDGDRWRQSPSPGPPGRAHTPMVFDSVRKTVVLFGGNFERGMHSDTWSWNGSTWHKVADSGPSARYRHRMAFDEAAGVIVLFGGLAGRTPLSDTWIWDGRQWTERKVPGPDKRSSHAMAYDPVRRRVLLFGGFSFEAGVSTTYADTWEWDGQKWTKVG